MYKKAAAAVDHALGLVDYLLGSLLTVAVFIVGSVSGLLAGSPTVSIGHSHGAACHKGRVYVWGTEYVSPCGREMPGLLGHGIETST